MSENTTESIVQDMSEGPFPKIPKEFPYCPDEVKTKPSSGGFWGKVAIAAVAGVAGLVAGVLLGESDNDDEACDCEDEDTEEDFEV